MKTGKSLSPPTKLILFMRKSLTTLLKQDEKSSLTYHPGKSHHIVVPQCELLQGESSSPSFYMDHVYLSVGDPLEQWIGCSCWSYTWHANGPFWNSLCRQILKQGNCHIQVGGGMYNLGTVKIASVVASNIDGTSGQH